MSDGEPGTGTNYEKRRKWNTTIRSEIPTGKTGPPFQIFHFFWEFSSGMNRRNVLHLPPNRKFRKFWLNGKCPKSHHVWYFTSALAQNSEARHVKLVGILSNDDGGVSELKYRQKSSRFRLEKQLQLCTCIRCCITLFCTFLCRHCTSS